MRDENIWRKLAALEGEKGAVSDEDIERIKEGGPRGLSIEELKDFVDDSLYNGYNPDRLGAKPTPTPSPKASPKLQYRFDPEWVQEENGNLRLIQKNQRYE